MGHIWMACAACIIIDHFDGMITNDLMNGADANNNRIPREMLPAWIVPRFWRVFQFRVCTGHPVIVGDCRMRTGDCWIDESTESCLSNIASAFKLKVLC